MSNSKAPTPSVQHIPTVLRRIQSGEVLVPAFQRDLVWKPNQIVELMRSIYLGFPIGSLLLWEVAEEAIDPGHLMASPFPTVQPRKVHSYVLDGQQRLAALYGCLYGEADRPERFRVAFDLTTCSFDYESEMPADGWIMLSELFSPKDFMVKQNALARLRNGDELLNNAIKLHSAFQEYLVPLVTIADRDVSEVVQIFERVNSTGTKLDTVDFMRAVTWSSGFDLNQEVRKLAKVAQEHGFKFSSETLVRVLAVTMGYRPTSQDMLRMRDQSAAQLKRGVSRAKVVLATSVKFLTDELGLGSADYLPYEAQLLVLAKLMSLTAGAPPTALSTLVARWILASSISEEFQGKADHRVARIVDSVEDAVMGGRSLLSGSLDINHEVMMERRLIRGKALSGAITVLLCRNAPLSPITGERIDVSLVMSKSSPELFGPVLSRAQLESVHKKPPVSTKVLANVVLCNSAQEAAAMEEHGWAECFAALERRVGRIHAQEVLASQLIDKRASAALREPRPAEFLKHRARSLVAHAQQETRRD